jgi:peroxiredoxin
MAQKASRNLERLGTPLDLEFTALDGREINLSRLKGKVVLIDFWATTCLPCVRELPDMKKLYSKFKPQGFEIIGISLDSKKEVLERFIQTNEIPWPQYFDDAGERSPLAKTFGIEGIPVVWLVDRHGVLRDLNTRQQPEKKIESLLKEK